MKKIENKEHDFSLKLRQKSVIDRLRKYIEWCRRSINDPLPVFAPVSINLDITSACNFSCPHCVDSGIINTGRVLDMAEIKKTLSVLQSFGLLSVILLGGGEPTLHRDFEQIVEYIKKMGLQLGIVTNGSLPDRIKNIAECLEQKDWVRLSVDSATQETFLCSHRPKNPVRLYDVLKGARDIKNINPLISLGYSFVIVWDGMSVKGSALKENISEMADAVRLAQEFGFDYISFKPCLLRLEDSSKEALFDGLRTREETIIIEKIKDGLAGAKAVADDSVKILESVNLQALLTNSVHELKKQPHICHLQFFNTVVTPDGIFHCPALRGVSNARIAEADGYSESGKFNDTLCSLAQSIGAFDACSECGVVACFYHHANWWVDNFINSSVSPCTIEDVEDDNFFL